MAQLHGCRFQKVLILKDQEIGRGAYGMVCKAQCDGLLCAAKLLHPVMACDQAIRNFHQECQILNSLKHPNVIQYLGTHDEGPNSPVLLMELMDTSLTSFLEGSPTPLPFHTEINLCHDVSLALAYLHFNGIIHRDLSSNNVLLTRDRTAKVTDFGMSKLLGSEQYTSRLTQAPGCAVYMPPEAQVDQPVYTDKLDSFSYGVLTIQILTRRFPSPGPPRKRVSDPKYGPNPIEVPIDEHERRKSHIDLIDHTHPLLEAALACLRYKEKDRPSSEQLCSQVGEMKRSNQYSEGMRKDTEGHMGAWLWGQSNTRGPELTQLREQLQSSESEKKVLRERIDNLQKEAMRMRQEYEVTTGELKDMMAKKEKVERALMEEIEKLTMANGKNICSRNTQAGSDLNILRTELLHQLRMRTSKETTTFKGLFDSNARLQEQLDEQRKTITRLEYEKGQIERLFDSADRGDDNRPSSGKPDKRESDHKLLQKELMEALRKKSEFADKVLEVTEALRKKDGELNQTYGRVREMEAQILSLKATLLSTQEKLEIEQITSRTVQDQHRTVQLQYLGQVEKARELEKLCGALKKELQLSVKGKGSVVEEPKRDEDQTQRLTPPLSQSLPVPPPSPAPSPSLSSSLQEADFILRGLSIIPSSSVHQFDAHESDVSALCFSPDGTCLATGGSDKVVKVWTLKPDMQGVDSKCISLPGSKGSIMSVQFDPTSKMVLTASNDNMVRLWSVEDQKCRHTLEGHTGKVWAAKFLADDGRRVVTGSQDRTLKIWDLQRGACTRTVFAGSSCSDVIATKRSVGAAVISGHVDKKIRFWDLRTMTPNEILLDGKITSVDHYPDRQLLLCCSQDDTLRLIDLRQNAITASFSAGGFKVGAEWTRACFSPDGQYVAAGSADGSVFVWEVTTGRMKSKKEHTGSTVVVCGWHPSGQLFASGDNKKKIVLWKR